jgi:undecaprenyl-diphosphatase
MSDRRPGPGWRGWVVRGRDWLRRRNLATVVLLSIAMVGVWAFIELADEVLEGETHAFDEWVLESLRSEEAPGQPLGPAWIREAMRDVTALGSYAVLVLLIVGVSGFCLLARNGRAMGILLVASVGGLLANTALKQLLSRQRPSVVPHLVEVQTQSFPSGHSMMAATVYLTLGVLLAQLVERRPLKSYFLTAALVLTLLVGASRVYLGVHYPTDVLAGWTAGAVWAIFSGLAVSWLYPKREGLGTGPPLDAS